MNTLDKQIQGVIENSLSKTMKIKIPLQSNDYEKNLLIQIIKNQSSIQEQIIRLKAVIAQLRSDIAVIKHHHEYYC